MPCACVCALCCCLLGLYCCLPCFAACLAPPCLSCCLPVPPCFSSCWPRFLPSVCYLYDICLGILIQMSLYLALFRCLPSLPPSLSCCRLLSLSRCFPCPTAPPWFVLLRALSRCLPRHTLPFPPLCNSWTRHMYYV